jgi:hypothetical protein
MVGGNTGEGAKATANVPTGSFPKANYMSVYRNGYKFKYSYQPGLYKK